jgi:SAM-dependent methyltransferase
MFRNRTYQVSRLIVAAYFLTAFSVAVHAQETEVRGDVPYVPTPQSVVDRMIELAQVGKGDYVIDLGSGDGRIVIAAIRAGADRALGVDINPVRIREANENAKKAGVTDRVEFRRQNLFETPIADATVITMYLLPDVNYQLRPRLLDELRPGTRIVSHAFHMAEWEADQRSDVGDRNVYFWVIPAKVEGRWELMRGNMRLVVEISQEFQKIEGKARIDGREIPLRDARLRGADIEFTLAGTDDKPVTYKGKANGREMKGDSGAGAWTAKHIGPLP